LAVKERWAAGVALLAMSVQTAEQKQVRPVEEPPLAAGTPAAGLQTPVVHRQFALRPCKGSKVVPVWIHNGLTQGRLDVRKGSSAARSRTSVATRPVIVRSNQRRARAAERAWALRPRLAAAPVQAAPFQMPEQPHLTAERNLTTMHRWVAARLPVARPHRVAPPQPTRAPRMSAASLESVGRLELAGLLEPVAPEPWTANQALNNASVSRTARVSHRCRVILTCALTRTRRPTPVMPEPSPLAALLRSPALRAAIVMATRPATRASAAFRICAS
jgi:hypothetical protein